MKNSEHWQMYWEGVELGLKDVDHSMVIVAYEPCVVYWTGKNACGKRIYYYGGSLYKRKTGGMDIVYGGG